MHRLLFITTRYNKNIYIVIINLIIIIKKSASFIIYNNRYNKNSYIVIINLVIIIKKSASVIIYNNKDTIKIAIL